MSAGGNERSREKAFQEQFTPERGMYVKSLFFVQQLAESWNLLGEERSLGILLREDRTKVIINKVFTFDT